MRLLSQSRAGERLKMDKTVFPTRVWSVLVGIASIRSISDGVVVEGV